MPDRNFRRLIIPLLAVAAFATTVAGASLYKLRQAVPATFHGTSYTDDMPAPGFTLTAHDGRRVSLADYRGRPVLLFFGYTHCPDVCPTTLTRLQKVRDELGRDARDLEVLLVTMDPARDTPPVLAKYVSAFGEGFTGLTGDEAALREAYAGYGAYVLPVSPEGRSAPGGHAGHGAAPGEPAMAHSSPVYGIDRAGVLRVVISAMATEEETREDVRTLARL